MSSAGAPSAVNLCGRAVASLALALGDLSAIGWKALDTGTHDKSFTEAEKLVVTGGTGGENLACEEVFLPPQSILNPSSEPERLVIIKFQRNPVKKLHFVWVALGPRMPKNGGIVINHLITRIFHHLALSLTYTQPNGDPMTILVDCNNYLVRPFVDSKVSVDDSFHFLLSSKLERISTELATKFSIARPNTIGLYSATLPSHPALVDIPNTTLYVPRKESSRSAQQTIVVAIDNYATAIHPITTHRPPPPPPQPLRTPEPMPAPLQTPLPTTPAPTTAAIINASTRPPPSPSPPEPQASLQSKDAAARMSYLRICALFAQYNSAYGSNRITFSDFVKLLKESGIYASIVKT